MWQIEVGRGKIEAKLVSPTDEKAISLKCFETVIYYKIELKIILLNKKNLEVWGQW